MENTQVLEDLAFIKKVMEQSRQTTINKGFGFVFWGIIVTLGLAATYFSIITEHYNFQKWTWIVLIGGGWIYTIIHSARNKRRNKPTGFTEKVIDSVWLSVGIVMTIFGFLATSAGVLKGIFIAPVMSLQLGIGFFITGTILRNNQWRIIALLWWIGAAVMMIYPGMYIFLLMSAMMLFLQVLPGILLYRKYKTEQPEEE